MNYEVSPEGDVMRSEAIDDSSRGVNEPLASLYFANKDTSFSYEEETKAIEDSLTASEVELACLCTTGRLSL